MEALVAKRGRIKAVITRNITWYNKRNKDDISRSEILNRRDQIKSAYGDFNDIQERIESLNLEGEDVEKQDQERLKFENEYFEIVGIFEDLLCTDQSIQSVNPSQWSSNTERVIDNYPQINVKLPQLSLPEFHGAYDKWSTFHDLFKSLIHENRLLARVQKLYYLQSALKGDAAEIIAELELTDDNYEIAWELLVDRYENKRKRINTHLQNIFDMSHLKKDCPISLRSFLDTYQKNIRALNNLERESDHWNSFLLFLLESKLDPGTDKDWDAWASGDNVESANGLISFLKERYKTLNKRPTIRRPETSKQKTEYALPKFNASRQAHVATNRISCIFCHEQHFVNQCKDFLKLSPLRRLNEIRKLKACTNCLKKGHFSQDCVMGTCRLCHKRHNTILHIGYKDNNNSQNSVDDTRLNSEVSTSNITHVQPPNAINAHSLNARETVILSTALVYIFDITNRPILCRALLDSGSQASFMTSELFNKLNLRCSKIDFPIVGINGACDVHVSKSTVAKIQSSNSNHNWSISFLVLDKITGMVPQCDINVSSVRIPQNLALADPVYFEAAPIDLLLGVNIFYELLLPNQIRINANYPLLQESKLGWIVSGPINTGKKMKIYAHYSQNANVQRQLESFWLLEEVNNKSQLTYSKEEIECENDFVQSFSRDDTGRFIVKLPVRENIFELGSSKEIALRRFQNLERKFSNNPELKRTYSDFMKEYMVLEHMTLIENPDAEPFLLYLPHHCVKKETSLTTKIRVVFDASAKSTSGYSLNDTLKVGPVIQDDIFSILLRFRSHNVVFTADIAKMYRQVLVHPDQQKLQCILWRFEPTEPLRSYKLKTLTYGTGPASFLATRCLRQLADENKEYYPKSSVSIAEDFYMDDYISGEVNEDEAIKRIREVSAILNSAGFVLRQWVSNKTNVLNKLDFDNSNVDFIVKGDQDSKTLGLQWNPQKDIFQFTPKVELNSKSRVTKRMILSTIAQLFDPLGLLGAVIVTAKIILQRLWQLKSDWDDLVPKEIFLDWNKFSSQMQEIKNIVVPRCAVLNSYNSVELHGFCDASTKAFSCCIYLKSTNSDGEVLVRLCCSKSRVAPLKVVTLPRLELCGALLLTQLFERVLVALKNISISECFFWSDSTIVLSWLKTEPYRLQTFVANRVIKITEISKSYSWNHVPTNLNPADMNSRGIFPNQLRDNNVWWNGPDFLKYDQKSWPKSDYTVNPIPELKGEKRVVLTIVVDDSLLERYSSYKRLKHIVAYMLRFFNNSLINKYTNRNRLSGSLQTEEMERSKIVLLKMVQAKYFYEEIRFLRKNKTVSNGSKLKCLNPFLDKFGVIRVGGRLSNSNLPSDCKHPAVLPSKGNFTKLVIMNAHLQNLHAGPQHVLSFLRSEFWPLSGRRTVRSVLNKCVICFKTKPLDLVQKMGDLPASRVNISRVFAKVGIDYAGPYLIKDTTKAVHIELISELTSEGFLNMFKRFIARRGLCSDIYSDNASNFVGANRELQECVVLSKADNFKTFVTESEINWHFIPARSPHFGGLWERAVGSVKYHLKRILYNIYLTYEDFYTLLTQIESILNSRPLTPLTDDPNDLQPLTPGHFIIGNALTSFNEPILVESASTLRSRYKHIQLLSQHFWNRWSAEYLHQLQVRSKWASNPKIVEIGVLVLLKEENSPPRNWRLGRILALHPGKDGVVRAVSIKTISGVVKRAVTKVCVLPIEC